MRIIDYIKQVDWDDAENKRIAQMLIADAKAYIERVEAHIYKGNEIRADAFVDFSEKQEEIQRLDRKRTEAHNKMLASFAPFLDVLVRESEIDKDDYMLDNRTQIADFVAMIAFDAIGLEPESKAEGNVRDELAEKMHNGEITYEQIEKGLRK